MIKVLGENYYIDIENITEKCKTGNLIKNDEVEKELRRTIHTMDPRMKSFIRRSGIIENINSITMKNKLKHINSITMKNKLKHLIEECYEFIDAVNENVYCPLTSTVNGPPVNDPAVKSPTAIVLLGEVIDHDNDVGGCN